MQSCPSISWPSSALLVRCSGRADGRWEGVVEMGTDRTTAWRLASGIIGPVLFVVAFLVVGSIRADYDPLRVFVSQLSLGDQGWLQIANFVISGFLIVAFAFGLREVFASGPASRWGPPLSAFR